jgi:hypothetical protein
MKFTLHEINTFKFWKSQEGSSKIPFQHTDTKFKNFDGISKKAIRDGWVIYMPEKYRSERQKNRYKKWLESNE